MEVLLKTFEEFDYLTHLEIALLFGCIDINNLDETISAIKEFRENYSKVENKLKTGEVVSIYNRVLKMLIQK